MDLVRHRILARCGFHRGGLPLVGRFLPNSIRFVFRSLDRWAESTPSFKPNGVFDGFLLASKLHNHHPIDDRLGSLLMLRADPKRLAYYAVYFAGESDSLLRTLRQAESCLGQVASIGRRFSVG